jgi:hypothetical protein
MSWVAHSMPAEDRQPITRADVGRYLNFRDLAYSGFFYCPVCERVPDGDYCVKCRHYCRWQEPVPRPSTP